MWNLNTGADTKCPAMEPMCQIMCDNKLPTSDTIHKWTLAPEVGQFHIGAFNKVEHGHWADTKCPVLKPMCQIMFYNHLASSDTIHKWNLGGHFWTLAPELGRFHIGALNDVEPTKCPAMKAMIQVMI